MMSDSMMNGDAICIGGRDHGGRDHGGRDQGDTICIGEINGVVCQYDQKATSMPPPDSTVRGERSFAIKSCRARRRVMDAAMSEAWGDEGSYVHVLFPGFLSDTLSKQRGSSDGGPSSSRGAHRD